MFELFFYVFLLLFLGAALLAFYYRQEFLKYRKAYFRERNYCLSFQGVSVAIILLSAFALKKK